LGGTGEVCVLLKPQYWSSDMKKGGGDWSANFGIKLLFNQYNFREKNLREM